MSVDKKIKKKLHLERIKKQQIINQHANQHKADQQKARDEQAELAAAMSAPLVTDAEGNVVWSAKTQQIRNRLNGKKRAAMDRWNRFAGTSGSGGMGR
ncbi:MAG: hypothetical protein U1E36_07045 [Rickettsiales bacterium]